MTGLRPIPFPAHAAFELTGGLALLVAPFALGFEPAALVLSVLFGTLLVGIALQAEDALISAHLDADQALAFALVAASIAVAAAGQRDAAAVFAFAAIAQSALIGLTRYSRRP